MSSGTVTQGSQSAPVSFNPQNQEFSINKPSKLNSRAAPNCTYNPLSSPSLPHPTHNAQPPALLSSPIKTVHPRHLLCISQPPSLPWPSPSSPSPTPQTAKTAPASQTANASNSTATASARVAHWGRTSLIARARASGTTLLGA
jgi:hypothetical protein